MEKIVKQCVGIDCSKDELAVCFSQLTEEWNVIEKSTNVFSNNPKGFAHLKVWADKMADKIVPVRFVVEATGVYHERLAHYITDEKQTISVVLPNKARYFAQTLKVRTVNDRECSKMLATLGLEKQLDIWEKPEPVYDSLKQLTRERGQLMDEQTMNSNQLHAEEHSAFPMKNSIKRIKKRMALLKKQISEIETEISKTVSANSVLSEKVQKICSIKGVGLITAITIIAETNGFNLIRNSKQLVSYAGYDVIEKQSGSSVKGKARISGKGNKHIRKALYFPAIVVVKSDPGLRVFYQRLEQKHGIKMKAYTAVQRKLLVLIYTLWKKNQTYNPEYVREGKKNLGQPLMEAALTELDHVRS